MTNPTIIDGTFLAMKKIEAVREQVEKICSKSLRAPKLAVILVGDNEASKIYVRNKEKKAKECFIDSETIILPSDVSKEELEETIFKLNLDEKVDAILLQLPLPQNLISDSFDEEYFLSLISPSKDVDCLTSFNQGRVFNGSSSIYPCTPQGVLNLIDFTYSDLDTSISFDSIKSANLTGKSALVVGRSLLVGKPLSLMLLNRNATVTMAHSKTQNLQDLVKDKDIIVTATGYPKLFNSQNVKDGAILIDVGINKLENGKLVGDLDFESFKNKDCYITPVPGGVGPMTIASLMENVVKLYKNR